MADVERDRNLSAPEPRPGRAEGRQSRRLRLNHPPADLSPGEHSARRDFGGGGVQHGTCRESGPSQKNPGCFFPNQGVLGDACLQSWFSLGPESLRPPRAWAPVGTAGEAGAEHLPIGRAPGSCPVLSLPLPLHSGRVEGHRAHFGGAGGVP